MASITSTFSVLLLVLSATCAVHSQKCMIDDEIKGNKIFKPLRAVIELQSGGSLGNYVLDSDYNTNTLGRCSSSKIARLQAAVDSYIAMSARGSSTSPAALERHMKSVLAPLIDQIAFRLEFMSTALYEANQADLLAAAKRAARGLRNKTPANGRRKKRGTQQGNGGCGYINSGGNANYKFSVSGTI